MSKTYIEIERDCETLDKLRAFLDQVALLMAAQEPAPAPCMPILMPKYRVKFARHQEAFIEIEAEDECAAWDTRVRPQERDWDSFGYETSSLAFVDDVVLLEDDDAEA